MRHRRAVVSYAKALFALAKERNQTELVGRELGDLGATFESDVDLRDFFARPWTPATVKRTVATEVAQRLGLSKLTCNFVALVAGRGRTDHIDAIAEKYRKLLAENLGRVRASVRTGVPLTDEERRMCPRRSDRCGGAARYCSRRLSTPRCSAASSWRAAASCWTAAWRASSSGCATVSRVGSFACASVATQSSVRPTNDA
jgi:F0F1-type ATP synthase delta subunit